ncbi:MAG: translocation/assembly module TamB domain-containing protein [Spirochaetales bacterium]|uniref:Translocation/assembly module TamB domain-containing protein n=1 Tax=Candidatus Thalassospirochaeta sargassi TaxID=3119039 RepID=A0AAJ1MN15_9SPIO|nr:translocation/assembly module TamB domain-containing protein [Spirochaetales bacterium]
MVLKPEFTRSFGFKLLITAILLSSLIILVFPVRISLGKIITDGKIRTIELLEDRLGHKITYSSISPSILHAFEIRDFTILSTEEPQEPLLEIERLRLSFDLFRYRSKNPLNAFRGLLLVNSRVSYNSTHNAELIDILEGFSGNGNNLQSENGLLLPDDFFIKGRNLSIKIITEEISAELSKIFFTLSKSPENDLIISLRSNIYTSAAVPVDSLPFNSLNLETELSLNGRLSSDFSWADVNLRTKNFHSNIVSIDRIAWNLQYDESGSLKIVKTGDNIPVDLDISAQFESGVFNASLQAQDFIFNKYFETSGFLNDFSNFLDASVNGEAYLRYIREDDDLSYSADLNILNIAGLLDSPVNASLSANGQNRIINIAESRVSSAPGSAAFQGTVNFTNELPIINGRLDVPGIDYMDINLRTSMQINTSASGAYRLSSGSIIINGLLLTNLQAELSPYSENLEFVLSSDVITGAEGNDSVYCEGIVQLGGDPYLQASLDINNLLVFPVLDALPVSFSLPEALEQFELTTELFFSGSFSQLAFASPDIIIRDRENDSRNLSFALSGNNSGARLSDIVLNWDDYNLNGKISTDISETGNIIVQTGLDLNGAAVNTSGVYSPSGTLSLVGDYGLKFNLFSIGEMNSFSLKTERLPINSAENTAFISTNIAGYFSSPDNWRILLNNLSINGLQTGFGQAGISLAAILSEDGGNIYKLNYTDRNTQLTGGGSVILNSILPGPSGRLHFNINSDETNENYRLLLGFNEGILEGSIDFSGFPIRRALEESPIDGAISGNVKLAGSLGSPQLRATLNSNDANLNGQYVSLNAALSYEDLKLKIEEINAEYSDYALTDVTGVFNLDNGIHNLGGRFTSSAGMLQMTSSVNIKAKTANIDEISDIAVLLEDDYSVDLFVNSIKLNEEYKEPWELNLDKREKLITITGGIDNEIACSFFGDGYFTIDALAPFPVRAAASGTINEGNINATVSELSYEFDNLEFVDMGFYEGGFTGKFRLQGPLNDPDFYGQIDFHDVIFKPPVMAERTEPLTTSFFLSGKELNVPATRVKTENGLAYVNITAAMERWLPRNYEININIPPGEAISTFLFVKPLYLDAFGEGDISLSGNFQHMHVSGDITASEGTFMINEAYVKEMGKNPIELVTCDLNITTGENNQFFWPNLEVPVLEAYVAVGNKLHCSFDGPGSLELIGDMTMKGGEIFYFERNFYIKEGGINFNSTTTTIDPLLNTIAEIRDISSEGEMTKIYLIVDPSPLSSFVPRFESEPSLSTSEIISIVGGNIFDSFNNDDSLALYEEAGLLAADIFTQFTLMQSIEDGLKSSLGLDLLSIRTSFLSNFLEGAVLSSSDDSSDINFGDYFDNTTLYLGKYFSDDIFLQGMIQFDLYNDTGYSEDLDMNIDSEITLEWEGPVANVELNFYPDFQDPVEGLSKTSLGLSWRFSY